MLPLGIAYFVIAFVGVSLGLLPILAPLVGILEHVGFVHAHLTMQPAWLAATLPLAFLGIIGLVVLTTLMHVARGIGRMHARIAKRLLVTPS
jgi:hypothetical protein